VRILVLVTDAFGGYGGIAKFNRDLLRALCSHPQCTEVIAIPRYMPSTPEALPSRLVYVTDGLRSKLHYLKAVTQAVRGNSSLDLILCGHINLLPIACFLRLLLRTPLLLQIHGIEAWRSHRHPWTNHCTRTLDGIISVSGVTTERFLSWAGCGTKQKYLLPNAVDMGRYGPGEARKDLVNRYGLSGKKVLMTLARLASEERYKGIDEVLDLMPALLVEIPNLVYLIAGDGSDRHRLEQKASSLSIDGNVVFTGYVAEAEKADLYRLADAFVMAGSGEGFGIVFLEAMACGVPVVASSLDGSREAVRNGTLGQVVNPGDPTELKAGILESLKRPRGILPKGLEYFSYEQFEKRCHRIVNESQTQHSQNEIIARKKASLA
jgi:phosphatidyl-myo-inositol dimannoside synthase